MLVHRVEAGEQLAEGLGADREHRREADRGVHRVAPADPVPEAEHVRGVDAELRDLLRVRGHGDEVLRDRRLVAEGGERPLARRVRVGHRLERREGLRRDDEERLVGREVARRLDEVGRVDIRDEPEGQIAPRVVAQRLVRHDRPEVGAADADVDDVPDRLARVPLPLAGADALGERGHAVERLVHLGDDVDSVHDERALPRHAQRDMQDRAVLGRVDPVAAEHGLGALAQSPDSSASCRRSASVSSVTRFFE